MSDRGDKTRRDGERGPLPRTNRPRPEAARRRADSEGNEAAVESAAPATEPSAVTAPEATEAAPELAPDAGALPTDSRVITPPPSTRREADEADSPPASTVIGKADESVSVMAERPTQLDTGRTVRTSPGLGTGRLKQVPLELADGASATAEAGPASTYLGCLVDGRYRIDGVLGRGGMGVVYRARHEVIDKLTAIKILLPTEDPEVVERFVNEARAASAIGNAHIVDTVDFGALPDGSTYFVMEYLEGQTLARRIKSERFIPAPQAIPLALQIAEGMSAAHRTGIVHRDLKPENIFLTRRDEEEDFVKLLDFGIAKMQHAQNRITRAGTIFGTPHYMSPEQAAGSEVDPRTDVYSLGIILYEMLAGRVPFDAENPMGLLTQHMYTEPVPLERVEGAPQAVPPALDAVVLKCLAKKPDDRYASMEDLQLDLERVQRGEPPAALADLLARAERDNDRELMAAAREGIRSSSSSGWGPWLIAGTSLLFLLAGGGLLFGAREEATNPLASVSASVIESANAPSPNLSQVERTVALVFSPIDGEVFRDGRSLGGMPVAVHLAPGEAADVEIRREGFYPETVRLDGTRSVVVVRLTAIPGVQPRIPVPTGEPLEAFRRAADAGAHAARARSRGTPDGGAPRRRGDAGAARHAAPAAAPSAVQAPEPSAAAPPVAPSPAPPAPPPVAPAPAPVAPPAVPSALEHPLPNAAPLPAMPLVPASPAPSAQ